MEKIDTDYKRQTWKDFGSIFEAVTSFVLKPFSFSGLFAALSQHINLARFA